MSKKVIPSEVKIFQVTCPECKVEHRMILNAGGGVEFIQGYSVWLRAERGYMLNTIKCQCGYEIEMDIDEIMKPWRQVSSEQTPSGNRPLAGIATE